MEIRVQQTSNVSAGNAVYTYPDGSQAAILFVRAEGADTLAALGQVYKLHGALTVNLSSRVPHYEWTSGHCRIHDDGITLAFDAVDPSAKNGGHGMLGAEATVAWGPTNPDWENAALKAACVWAGLVSEEAYQRVCLANPVVNEKVLGPGVHLSDVPPMPLLKLTARRG